MNVVHISGRMCADPETRLTPERGAVLSFRLAVPRGGKAAGSDFVPCVAYDKPAEMIGKLFVKGKPIIITGHLNITSYEDKNGGNRRQWAEVVVDRWEFVLSDSTGTASQDNTVPASYPVQGLPPEVADGYTEIGGDDVPLPF